MKVTTKRLIISISGIFIMAIIAILVYIYTLSAPSKDDTLNDVTIKPGSIISIGQYLEKEGYIRSANAFKVYMYTESNKNLKAGTYQLSKNMGIPKIVKILREGSKYNPDEITITFKEGKNVRSIATTISQKTNNNYEDIINVITNREYIQSLINKYWFLTDDILNANIYYPLEGYLFPNTYSFKNKDVTVEEILETMLNETNKQLEPYKNDIISSNLSINKLITLASIIELEGATSNDRAKVSGVFYNRLNSGWSLGSDVTTYYALKIDDFSVSLTKDNGLYDCSTKYNTRCTSFIGLPVGPIDNPGIISIKAAIYPEEHDYYYFVADCKGKTYLNKDETGHFATINKLKKENNWCA